MAAHTQHGVAAWRRFVPISVLSTLAPNAAVLRSHAEANLVEAARRSGVLVVNEDGTMFKRRHPFDRTAALGYVLWWRGSGRVAGALNGV